MRIAGCSLIIVFLLVDPQAFAAHEEPVMVEAEGNSQLGGDSTLNIV